MLENLLDRPITPARVTIRPGLLRPGRENRARGRGHQMASIKRRPDGRWRGPLPRRPGSRTLEALRSQDRRRDLAGSTDHRGGDRRSRRPATEPNHCAGVLRRLVTPPGLGIRYAHIHGPRDAFVRARRVQARAGEPLAHRGLDQAHGRPATRARNDQDPLQQRTRRLPRGGSRPAHRTRPDRSSPTASSAARRREHDDPEHRGGRRSRHRCRRLVPRLRGRCARSPVYDSARPRRFRSPTSTSCGVS